MLRKNGERRNDGSRGTMHDWNKSGVVFIERKSCLPLDVGVPTARIMQIWEFPPEIVVWIKDTFDDNF